MAPTGVAAEKVGGKTIHSKLKITEYIIIKKISMVSFQLFTFISKIFCKLYSNSLEFGGIPVFVIGDLTQIPPVKGDPVFYSPLWKIFFPLFLRKSCRQQDNDEFFQILQKVRIGEQTIQAIKLKVEMYQEQNNTTLNTTYIVSHRKMAQTINSIISTKLSLFNSNEKSFTSISVNSINNE
ncbi:hypothetical protein RclHR1_33040002 [Rhizophagus clarus]|uniref:ATP-dependent DNA helicase n=1 Tax=Rhizophagus clarus TaxID=94130 RepID=A0A2Z6R9E8_9GLOM|nr:hypothetical protein RclHR1_33040002 [Rhizophagus clarus]